MPRGVPAAPKPASTAVALRQCSFPMVLENYGSFVQICDALSKSGATGERRTQQSVLAVAMKGAELGLPPMTAIDSIYVIEGRTMLSSSLAQSLVYRDFPGAKFEIEEGVDFCAVRLTVPNREPYTAKYTMADAEKAGQLAKANWKKNPKAMLRARAIAQACRVVAPDCLAGMYCVEEFGEIPEIKAKVIEADDVAVTTTARPIEVVQAEIVEEVANQPAEAKVEAKVEAKPAAVANGNGNGHHANGASHSSPAEKLTTPQANCLRQLKEGLLIANDEWMELIQPFGVKSARDLTKSDAEKLINQLRKRKEEQATEPVGAAGN